MDAFVGKWKSRPDFDFAPKKLVPRDAGFTKESFHRYAVTPFDFEMMKEGEKYKLEITMHEENGDIIIRNGPLSVGEPFDHYNVQSGVEVQTTFTEQDDMVVCYVQFSAGVTVKYTVDMEIKDDIFYYTTKTKAGTVVHKLERLS